MSSTLLFLVTNGCNPICKLWLVGIWHISFGMITGKNTRLGRLDPFWSGQVTYINSSDQNIWLVTNDIFDESELICTIHYEAMLYIQMMEC